MAKNTEGIPSLIELALKYGTISSAQYTHLSKLSALVARGKTVQDDGEMLLEQKMATSYQVSLLKLIRDYYIIRRRGEVFGKIAVEKGFATQADIQRALDIQKKEFKESRLKKLMGDILVETGTITARQKNQILREQTLLDKKSKEILETHPPGKDIDAETLSLSAQEQAFLRVKALDQEFRAAVLEKGLASEKDITRAETIQEALFHQKKAIKIIGDIMVSLSIITIDQKNLILEEQGRSADIEQKDEEPGLSIRIARDTMTAWIHIADSDMGKITLEAVKNRLAKEKITRGIYPDAILNAWINSQATRFPAARTDYSKQLHEACNCQLLVDQDLTEKGEKRRGDRLLTQTAVSFTGPRKNIFNQETETAPEHDFTFQCGPGTRTAVNKTSIIAAKTGVPSIGMHRILYVHPIIHVLEDADLRYGQLEPYAALTVSGTITGAYPVTAGNIIAEEIRDASIDAIGGINARVGITDSAIRAQGDIHARYLHNCTVETFGNVYVENEIIDSRIRCCGTFDSPNCRAISSEICAKKGVVIQGAGSERTRPCEITAGGEHHLISNSRQFLEKMQQHSYTLTALEDEHDELKRAAKKTFRKMVELKIFYDRAKHKKQRVIQEFKKNRADLDQQQAKNIHTLISNFERRMETSILELKHLNRLKKEKDKRVLQLKKKIVHLTPKVQTQIRKLEQALFAGLEWGRSIPGQPFIHINAQAFPGTVLAGVYASTTLDQAMESIVAEEHYPGGQPPFMNIHRQN